MVPHQFHGFLQNRLPKAVHRSNVFFNRFPWGSCFRRGRKTLGVLQTAVFAIGIGCSRGFGGWELSQAPLPWREGYIAEIAGEFMMQVGIAENEVLDDKFNINNAAVVLL